MPKSILIVEDDAALLRALSDKLLREGFHIYTALNGESGLSLALEKQPDLILLDVLLPKIGGVTFLQKITEDAWGKSVPVIAITNSSDSKLEEDVREAGANIVEYLVKASFTLKDIVEKVKEITEKN